VVLHPLTVDNLSLSDRHRFLKSHVLYKRLKGSDKAFVFDENTAICSHPNQQHKLSSKFSNTPKLIRNFASFFDFIQCESRLGFSLRDIAKCDSCAGAYGRASGDEDEGHFFNRCVQYQGGKTPNAANVSQFCLSGTNGADLLVGVSAAVFGVHNPDPSLYTEIGSFCPEFTSLLGL
jgi:hypothetical protein